MAKTRNSAPADDNDCCKNCGACKHCGAGGRPQYVPMPYPVYPYPYVQPRPYVPYVQPMWQSPFTNISGGVTPGSSGSGVQYTTSNANAATVGNYSAWTQLPHSGAGNYQ